MDAKEIAQEMLNFLNENSQYTNFLSHMEGRGFDVDELEDDIETKIEI
jgi:hypothetical protein